MDAFDQPCYDRIEDVPISTIKLRARLIEEESAEYHKEPRGAEELDGICDLIYVVVGTALVGNVPIADYLSGQIYMPNSFKIQLFGPVKDLTQELWCLFPCPRRTKKAIDFLLSQLMDASNTRGYYLVDAFNAVHKNNMAKLWALPSVDPTHTSKQKPKGYLVKDPHGKILKPKGHAKVNLNPFVK